MYTANGGVVASKILCYFCLSFHKNLFDAYWLAVDTMGHVGVLVVLNADAIALIACL